MKFTAVNSGLISAVASIILALILYILGPAIFVNGWSKFTLFVLSIGLTLYLGLQGRTEAGGYFSYGQAFKYLIIMTAISLPVAFLFNYVLGVVDPGFVEKVSQLEIDKSVSMLEGFGMSEDQINKAVIQTEERIAFAKTALGQLMGFGFALAFMAVIDLLLALFIKRNKPEFAA